MKKIRNVENPFEFETVVFSFSEEQILRELTKVPMWQKV